MIRNDLVIYSIVILFTLSTSSTIAEQTEYPISYNTSNTDISHSSNLRSSANATSTLGAVEGATNEFGGYWRGTITVRVTKCKRELGIASGTELRGAVEWDAKGSGDTLSGTWSYSLTGGHRNISRSGYANGIVSKGGSLLIGGRDTPFTSGDIQRQTLTFRSDALLDDDCQGHWSGVMTREPQSTATIERTNENRHLRVINAEIKGAVINHLDKSNGTNFNIGRNAESNMGNMVIE